jgi:hypothetical protein
MSDVTPKRRRTRTIFHYKIDEVVRPADRENYLALAGDPRMRNQDAHGWLLGQGYQISLSAVARHRRRFWAESGRLQSENRLTESLARMLGRPDAPDFAAAADVQFQHLVFRHLMNCDQRTAVDEETGLAESGRISSAELLRLTKLVKSCVDLTVARVRR